MKMSTIQSGKSFRDGQQSFIVLESEPNQLIDLSSKIIDVRLDLSLVARGDVVDTRWPARKGVAFSLHVAQKNAFELICVIHGVHGHNRCRDEWKIVFCDKWQSEWVHTRTWTQKWSQHKHKRSTNEINCTSHHAGRRVVLMCCNTLGMHSSAGVVHNERLLH